MAKLGFNFDANKQEEVGFGPVPPGRYPVIIVESDVKANKTNTGAYLELKMEIQGGAHDGRFVWDRLNIHHQNPKAENIARSNLKRICEAVGENMVNDSSVLHDKLFDVKVIVDREDRNEVKGFFTSKDGPLPDHGGQPPTPQAVPEKKPWES